jgi:adenosylhomocysteinase
MSTQTAEKVNTYKVKDMSLAEWGRKEIKLAEAEMPGSDESAHRSMAHLNH